MVKIYDKETGGLIGTVTDEQLVFLVDHLEEETSEDQDYYLDQDSVDLLEEKGAASSLLSLLRKALGKKDSIEIRWSRE